IAIDAFLDFDPTRLQVVAINHADGASNPLPITLQEYVDPATGHVDLSYGAITGPDGTGASGYFRLARITLRPSPGALTGLTAPVTTALTFALPGEANPDPSRGTTVYGVSDSLLRAADPFQAPSRRMRPMAQVSHRSAWRRRSRLAPVSSMSPSPTHAYPVAP
ncbi:MAG: hypothetical protein EBT47_13190, partial [Chloroflexi bacterium]|nr:hypothetical protein [Chloroflexota bacterium]